MHEPQRNQEARAEMLAAIRARLIESVPFDAAYAASHHELPVRRAGVRPLDDGVSALAQFRHALSSVGAHCVIVPGEAEATTAITGLVEAKAAQRIAVSDSPVIQRLTRRVSSEVTILSHATKAEMFDCEIGITTAQWGIAETGTLVLESNDERHRLASLVPPVHVAVIQAGSIRRTMGEVLELIQHGDQGLSRAVTFITGTSRTSDIELTLAIGVHGPAELHVIVIEGAAG